MNQSVSPLQSNLLLKQQAYIDGLPENLRAVPNDPEKWRLWAQAIKAYRVKVRRECSRDLRLQRVEWERCRRDTAYFITVWGVIFEPRTVENRPPEWKPFILFPFQVHMVRWVEEVLKTNELGRGDGFIEKSRDMGATNMFCAIAVKHFIFDEVFICGFLSKKFEDVDKKIGTGTIFYKLRSILGAEDGVPPDLRLPQFLQPPGFDPDIHIAWGQGGIRNPNKGQTCFLVGETTTALSGVSDRNTMRVIDEAARFDEFESSWTNQQATTDHRFAVSSPDTSHGLAFYEATILGKECLISPEKEGPSLLTLSWDLHPFHTPEWFKNQRARARSNGNAEEFSREYELEYFTNRGGSVYPRARDIEATNAPYDPLNSGPIYCLIDPGTRDPSAIIWLQQEYNSGYWNVVNSFEGHGNEDVSFYASVITGSYLSGELGYDYDSYEGIHEVMEFASGITQQVIYVGDPAGNARGGRGDDKSTWYEELRNFAIKNLNRTIYVNTMTAGDARSYEVRKQAVNEILPRLRFHANRGGRHVLHCLQESKYRKPRVSGRSESLEPVKPEHDKYSHTRSALEFGAVWITRMVEPSRREQRTERAPMRRSLSGNMVSGRQSYLFSRGQRKAGMR